MDRRADAGAGPGGADGFYREDEAAGFSVHAWPVERPNVVVLQCHQSNHPPPWRAIAADGQVVGDSQALPPGLYNVQPIRKRRRSDERAR